MYKFVRITNKKQTDKGVWYFVPQTVEQIFEHAEKFVKPHIQNGFNMASSKIINAAFKYGDASLHDHFTDYNESAIANLTEIHGLKQTPLTMFETANNMYFETIHQRVKQFFSKRTLYLANGVQNFGYSPQFFDIAEEIETEDLVFPYVEKLNLEDTRYIQWEGGQHWYAKIGIYDVVDENNNQKWNTKEEAEKAAKWYCENY